MLVDGVLNLITHEAVIEGEEGLKSLAPPLTAHMVHLTSLYKVVADNFG